MPRFLVIILLLATFPLPRPATASERGPVCALLPLANHSNVDAARLRLRPRLQAQLEQRGYRCLTDNHLRDTLRRYRLRTSGSIDAMGAKLLVRASGVSFLALASIDIYREAPVPELALSLRLLNPSRGEIVAAASASASGEDFVISFDRGRIESMETLIEIVVNRLFARLTASELEWRRRAAPVARVAIVPLEVREEALGGGDVVQNQLLAELMAAGYRVLEPGFLRQRMLVADAVTRGGIGEALLAELVEAYTLDYVVTGDLERFRFLRGDARVDSPSASGGLRLVDARSTRTLLVQEFDASGADEEGMFQRGRIHGLGTLIEDTLRRFVAGIGEQLEAREKHAP